MKDRSNDPLHHEQTSCSPSYDDGDGHDDNDDDNGKNEIFLLSFYLC